MPFVSGCAASPFSDDCLSSCTSDFLSLSSDCLVSCLSFSSDADEGDFEREMLQYHPSLPNCGVSAE